ncbi:MAG: lipopolysaccharide heptosyltransferase I [Acidobacteria bacterium]|nr:lipopolysaccharide heptosyltransferase I [Acidobacteriota bacterium]MCA1641614.1 lipopolysaccharide heptosyltransferase I [Acidobacteriota bacterium]
MRLLFVKLGSIGDVVHTLPALAAARRALAGAEISWVVERGAAEILRDNPLIENLIVADTKALRRVPVSGETLSATRRQLRRLRASAFDSALDFQGLLKSALIARLSGARRTYGFARANLREPASRFLLHEQIETPARSHVISKNLALVAGALGVVVPTDPKDFEFPVATNESHEREAEGAAASAGAPFALLNPGGGWVTKLWGAERFGALADALFETHGLRSLVTHGPGEAELAARVVASSKLGAAQPVSLSLKGFYALARRSEVYVGGDTGPTHLAIAAGAPVVGLFGPTEWWRNGSPRPEDIEVGRADITCRVDCHRRACSNWVCMDIEVARVAEAVGERLRRSGVAKGAEVVTVA